MKQSKEMMEVAREFADMNRKAEERGAAREQEKYAKELQTITGGLLAIVNRLSALGGVDCTVEVQRNAFAKEKPAVKKRKAVEASEESLDEMRKAMTALHESTQGRGVFKPLQVNKALGISTILAGRYMGILANRGILEKVGTKGYRLVTPKENGLDEQQG